MIFNSTLVVGKHCLISWPFVLICINVFTQRHHSTSFIPEPSPSNHQLLPQSHYFWGDPVLQWSKLWQWDWLVKTYTCCTCIELTVMKFVLLHGCDCSILCFSGTWTFSHFLPMSALILCLKRVPTTLTQRWLLKELLPFCPEPKSWQSLSILLTGHTLGIRWEWSDCNIPHM